MPILWRYLLQSYLRVFLLSVSTFISVLFVLRFKDIARFAALSADFLKTGLYVVYQFPLILPIAIPISALIASLLLFQRLSRSYELTALRASGLSLKTLVAPLLFASALLSLVNFSISAELSPFCRREVKTLLYRKTSANPLILLQRQQLVRLKNAYLNMAIKDDGQSAKDLIAIAYNESNGRLSLISAKKLWIDGETLFGKEMAILSHLPADTFDQLVLENQSLMSTSAPLLSKAIKKSRPNIDANALSYRHLKIQLKESSDKKSRLAFIEILRRFSLSGAVFSFTLLGCAYGIELGRTPGRKNLLAALAWTLLVLVSYLLGKSLRAHPLIATVALLIPHPILWAASIRKFLSVSRGGA
ncbi:MAG: LptF/LptG family permease [Verrucomicrobia bacterium]|nr:LptF/LptG family permease [Verrucomicrobiota bacterium]